MNLELLRGVSTYFLIHECCPWKKVWVNYRMHCPARSLCSPGTSQHSSDTPFFLCSSYPQTQWCSLAHSWLVLIFHFLCQVTVGVLFHVLFRGWLLSAIFPRSPLWQFSYPPCDHGSECLSSWLFHSVAAAFASLWSSRREGEFRGQGKPSPNDSKDRPQSSSQSAEWRKVASL